MKLAVFVSDYRLTVDTLPRLKPEKLGIILVQNGVYHAVIKEKGAASLLNHSADYYALQEDMETRGLDPSTIDKKVKVVKIGDVVDLIFNDYEKTAWL